VQTTQYPELLSKAIITKLNKENYSTNKQKSEKSNGSTTKSEENKANNETSNNINESMISLDHTSSSDNEIEDPKGI